MHLLCLILHAENNISFRLKEKLLDQRSACDTSQMIDNDSGEDTQLIPPPSNSSVTTQSLNPVSVLNNSNTGEALPRIRQNLEAARSMTQPDLEENEGISLPYSSAVTGNITTVLTEVIQPSIPFYERSHSHTYREGLNRSNTRKDTEFDPIVNKKEWKMHAR